MSIIRIMHGHAKHGSQHPLYKVWVAMHQRCSNQNNKHFHRYGGRGIKVCARWNDFRHFIADMGERPDGGELERINNDGPYEPSNCRWATRKQQLLNTSRNHFVLWQGKRQTLREWADELGMNYRTLCARIRKGWEAERALTRPASRWLAKGVR